MCISPVPCLLNNYIARNPNIATYSSGDSNQSPSSSSSRVEAEVQTDPIFEFEYIGTRQDDFKKDKYKEELLRINSELKQSLEIQKAKVRASKETIECLLVKQSRMERKQVFFYYLNKKKGKL